jgi:hypothetical protein
MGILGGQTCLTVKIGTPLLELDQQTPPVQLIDYSL